MATTAGAGAATPWRSVGCGDLDVPRIRLVVLSEATIIGIESDPKFDPPESRNLNRLAGRSASTLRAE